MYNVYFKGSETAGSIAKTNLAQTRRCAVTDTSTPDKDAVCFRGNMDKSDSAESVGKVFAGIAAAAVLIAGGLGYAHKAGWVNKIKSEKVKEFVSKMSEPCYNTCHKTKEYAVKYYDKIKNFFNKKS